MKPEHEIVSFQSHVDRLLGAAESLPERPPDTKTLHPEDICKRRGIPLLYQEATIPSEHRAGLKRPHDLLILGRNGRGKSYLAAAVAKAWDAQWLKVNDLCLEMKRSWRQGESQFSMLRKITGYRTVVVDDLMAGSGDAHELRWLFAIVDSRLERRAPSVITCDQPLSFVEKIHAALASRLSGFRQIVLTGPDRRRR